MPTKAILFDVDGVLILTPKFYSHQHAEEFSIEASQIEPFFKGEFRLATIGKADLKQLLEEHRDLWAWKGTPEALMERWFEAESNVDHELVAVIQKLRRAGIKCYIATDQEKYRAAYLRDRLFADKFDGMFVSCEIGLEKKDPKFFKVALKQLRHAIPGLTAADVTYFDDSHEKVASAAKSGINAVFYTGREQVAALTPVL